MIAFPMNNFIFYLLEYLLFIKNECYIDFLKLSKSQKSSKNTKMWFYEYSIILEYALKIAGYKKI